MSKNVKGIQFNRSNVLLFTAGFVAGGLVVFTIMKAYNGNLKQSDIKLVAQTGAAVVSALA